MKLGEYLSQNRGAWDWINHDCSRWLDCWLIVNGHASAMDAIGIVYDSEQSSIRTIVRGGGLLALWARGMDAIGIPPVEVPAQGDAAILDVPTDDGVGQTCGIWTGQRWASVHRTGLICGVGQPLAMWRV